MHPEVPGLLDSRIGSLLSQTYRIERVLGVGGMGTVYAAQHIHLQRPVAVKVLHPQIAEKRVPLERFRREAQIASQLGHPGLVSVLDFNFTEDGAPYMVMEFLPGETLLQRLTRGPLSLAETCGLFARLCDALHVVHEAGVVHRDLKPENIFLLQQEGPAAQKGPLVKILDFGISKIHDVSSDYLEGEGELTGHEVLGTPSYLAPEQAAGSAREADRRADIFALGTILYECLTGQRAFDGPHAVAILRAMMHDPIPQACDRLPGLPPAVDQVIARACAKDPTVRFATARQMYEDLSAAVGPGLLLPAATPPPPQAVPRPTITLEPSEIMLSTGPPAIPATTMLPPPEASGQQQQAHDDQGPPLPTEIVTAPAALEDPSVVLGAPPTPVPPARPELAPPAQAAQPAKASPPAASVSRPPGPFGPADPEWGDGDTLFDAEVDDLRAAAQAAYGGRSPAPAAPSSSQAAPAPASVIIDPARPPWSPSLLGQRPEDAGYSSAQADHGLLTIEVHAATLAPTEVTVAEDLARLRAASYPPPLYPPNPQYIERPTTILDTVATPPEGVQAPLRWGQRSDSTLGVPKHSPQAQKGQGGIDGHRSWGVTVTTALVAVLVGIVVGMITLKLMSRHDQPSLALEQAQQIQQAQHLLEEGERLLSESRCGDAIQKASAVLLLSPDNARARQIIRKCKSP